MTNILFAHQAKIKLTKTKITVMKKLLFFFTLAAGLLFHNAINAQTNIIVCGSVVGTNGAPVTVYLADS